MVPIAGKKFWVEKYEQDKTATGQLPQEDIDFINSLPPSSSNVIGGNTELMVALGMIAPKTSAQPPEPESKPPEPESSEPKPPEPESSANQGELDELSASMIAANIILKKSDNFRKKYIHKYNSDL